MPQMNSAGIVNSTPEATEELAEPIVDDGLDQTFDLGVPQLGLCLSFELGFADLDRDHRGQALAAVLAGQRVVLRILAKVGVGQVVVDRARQRSTEPRQVRTAFMGIDRVRKRVDRVVVRIVPLQRDLQHHVGAVALDVDRLVQYVACAIQVLDKLGDAALVMEDLRLRRLAPLIGQRDLQTLVQERHLAQAMHQRVIRVDQVLEDLGIGTEGDLRAASVGGARLLELGDRCATLVVLFIGPAVAPDLDAKLLR